MPWFRLKTDTEGSAVIFGDTAREAAARYERDRNAPLYCRLHEDLAPERCSGPVGSMGYYTPHPTRVISAQPMREGYSGGGMCVSEDGPEIDLLAA